MAKRVVWIASAVLLTAFGTLLYVATSHTLLALYPDVRLFSAVLLFAVAMLLCRRVSRVALILMLCGSVGLVLAYAHDWFIWFGLRHQWFEPFGDGWVFYGYMKGRERPYLVIPANMLRILGFCFPLGLLLVALQRDNQAI